MRRICETKKIPSLSLWVIDVHFPYVGLGMTKNYMPYVLRMGELINMSNGMKGVGKALKI